jgi:hypothetical protein
VGNLKYREAHWKFDVDRDTRICLGQCNALLPQVLVAEVSSPTPTDDEEQLVPKYLGESKFRLDPNNKDAGGKELGSQSP